MCVCVCSCYYDSGQISFFLLCMQYSRAQFENLGTLKVLFVHTHLHISAYFMRNCAAIHLILCSLLYTLASCIQGGSLTQHGTKRSARPVYARYRSPLYNIYILLCAYFICIHYAIYNRSSLNTTRISYGPFQRATPSRGDTPQGYWTRARLKLGQTDLVG